MFSIFKKTTKSSKVKTPKRVVYFFELIDEIPAGAKFLFSETVHIPMDDVVEAKGFEAIKEPNPMRMASFQKCYYEISELDFQDALQNGLLSTTPQEKALDLHILIKAYEKTKGI